MQRNIVPGSEPLSTLLPHPDAFGRPGASRMVTVGTP